MRYHYADIRERIAEQPKWWDEHGVPRYCEFAPNRTANIYADEAALIEIECQHCGASFLVAWTGERITHGVNQDGTTWVKDSPPFDPQTYEYGDPPNAGCCDIGACMSSIPRRVVEFWRRHHKECTKPDPSGRGRVCTDGYFDWRHIPELEVVITDEALDAR